MDRLGTLPAVNRAGKNGEIPLKSYAPGKVIGHCHSTSAQPQCQHILGWFHHCSVTTFQAHVQELSQLGFSIINDSIITTGCTVARYVLLAGEPL